MGRKHTRSKAKRNSPYKIGDIVSFLDKRGIGKIIAIRAEILQSGVVYDITVEDDTGKQYYLYGSQIDEVI